jgi:hypothetical protein
MLDFACFAECIKNTACTDDIDCGRSSREDCLNVVGIRGPSFEGDMGKFWLHALGCVSLTIAWLGGGAPRLLAQAEALPNGFSDEVPTSSVFAPDPPAIRNAYHPRWELTSELVYFLFRRPEPNFPLATTGSAGDVVPGALGQPGTTIIAGSSSFPENLHVGGKVTATYWLTDEPETLGLQASYFIMEMATTNFGASSQGNVTDPVLARPYFNPVLGAEAADLRAFPGTLAGSASSGFATRLMGADGSVLYNMTGYSCLGPSLFVLAGPRFIKFDERYSSNDTATVLPAGTGTTTTIQDNFSTSNIFYGGQIGAQFRYRLEGVTFDFIPKVAIGNNHETLTIGGFTSVTNQVTGQTITGAQGLFAQPSNIGEYHRNVFMVIPEIGVKLHVDLTENIKVTFGYNYLNMTHVARPADQIDRSVNIQPVGSTTQIGPAVPIQPATISQTSFWAHYFAFGVELVF